MSPSREPIPAMEINSKSLIPKTLFAIFGHLQEYQDFSTRYDDLDEREMARFRRYSENLREVCRLAHTCLIKGDYDKGAHPWIMGDQRSDSPIPRKFTGIASQIEKREPSLDSKKTKVFPIAFAAICVVLRDILTTSGKDGTADVRNIREIVDLDSGNFLEEQGNVLRRISDRLREIASQNNPNWPITYEGLRPSIKVDKGNYFVVEDERRGYEEDIEGRYFVFRKAFLENPNGYMYIREQLSIYSNASGPLFKWTTRVGADEVPGTFRGVALFPRRSFWLVGYDEKPMQRMWVATVDFREIIDYRREGSPYGRMVSGIVMSNVPDPMNPYPDSRNFLMRSILRGEPQEENFGNGARFLKAEEILKYISEDDLQKIS